MSQLVFSMCCDPKELGSNASEEMDLAVRERAKSKEQMLPSSMSFL